MKGVPAVYLGRIVEKEHFRTFIYAPDGSQKLVESWDDFEKSMESGVWFATKEDAQACIPVEKPKRIRNKAPEKESEVFIKQEIKQVQIKESVEDIKKDDDFLPKSRK